VKQLEGKEKASRKGAKPQRHAKKPKGFHFAFLGVLASWREDVNFFTASDPEVFPFGKTQTAQNGGLRHPAAPVGRVAKGKRQR
jgi:hypothetical protein